MSLVENLFTTNVNAGLVTKLLELRLLLAAHKRFLVLCLLLDTIWKQEYKKVLKDIYELICTLIRKFYSISKVYILKMVTNLSPLDEKDIYYYYVSAIIKSQNKLWN